MGKLSEFIKKNKILLIVLSIIALFLIMRIPALNQEVYGDELYNYYYSYTSYSPRVSFDPTAYSSFFMSIIFYKIAFMIYPSIVSLRIVSLLFGLGILLLGMKTLDEFFSRKAAIIFGIIYSVVPWAVFTSILLDNDGTITSFMFMVLIYVTLKFFHEDTLHENKLYKDKFHKDKLHEDKFKSKRLAKSKYLIIIGVVSGAMILLKYAIFLSIIAFYILMLGYYLLYTKRMAFKKALYNIYVYCLSAVISTIALLLLYALFLGSTAVSYLVKHYADIPHNNFAFGGFSLTFILQVVLLLMMISPIVIVFLMKLIDTVRGVAKKDITEHGDTKIKSEYLVFISLCYILQLTALLYAYNSASMNRYASFLIIPIILLSSIFLSKFFDNKKIWLMTICAIFLSAIYFLIDLFPQRILDFYPKTEWIKSVLGLKWNFLVPINGASGPLGIYISFLNIVWPFAICVMLALWALWIILFSNKSSQKFKSSKSESSKKKSKKPLEKLEKNLSMNLGRILMLLSIVALSYCVYVSLQFSYSITSPSISSINYQLRTECAPKGYSDGYYVFRNSAGFFAQNQQNFSTVKILSHDMENNATVADIVVNSKENVCVIDFPQISKSSILWTTLEKNCLLEKTYSSNGYVIGYWFKC